MNWNSGADPTEATWASDGEAKTRKPARKGKRRPHECNTPDRWWKTQVGRSWVCYLCRRRWRIVEVRQDSRGDYPVWERQK